MSIKHKVNHYLSLGMNIVEARIHAASDIFLGCVSLSNFKTNVTLKGGVLVYHLTNNKRRMTRDLDIDFIHYPTDEASVDHFLKAVSNSKEEISINRISEIEELHHEDYHGIGFKVKIKQGKEELELNIDVGVHTYSVMDQTQIVLCGVIEPSGLSILTNSIEQIVIEKTIATYRLGIAKARYRDLDDIYYFIKNNLVNRDVFKKYLSVVLKDKNITQDQLIDRLKDIYSEDDYISKHDSSRKKWLDVDVPTMSKEVIAFIDSV